MNVTPLHINWQGPYEIQPPAPSPPSLCEPDCSQILTSSLSSLTSLTQIIGTPKIQTTVIQEKNHPMKHQLLPLRSNRQHATSQLEQLLSARQAKESVSLLEPSQIQSLENIEAKKESKFNKKLFKELLNFIAKQKNTFPTTTQLEQRAIHHSKKTIDEIAQKIPLSVQSGRQTAKDVSPRSQATLESLQTSGVLTKETIEKIEAVKGFLVTSLMGVRKKTQWSQQLEDHLRHLISFKKNLPAFVDWIDSKINDQQILEIVYECFSTKKEEQAMILATLRRWTSTRTIETLKPLVRTLFQKHIERENIPNETHEWCELKNPSPLQLIPCKEISQTLQSNQYGWITVNGTAICPTDLANLFHQIQPKLPLDEIHIQKTLFEVCNTISWEKVEKKLENRPVVWEEIQQIFNLQPPLWERVFKSIEPGVGMSKLQERLIPILPILRLTSRSSFGICLDWMESIYPKLFQKTFIFSEIPDDKQAECEITLKQDGCYSVVQRRFFSIKRTSDLKQLAVTRIKWTVSPNLDPPWIGELKICDLYLDESACDVDLKWQILDCFIDYVCPDLPKQPDVLSATAAACAKIDQTAITAEKK
jgi:hypothetical protein